MAPAERMARERAFAARIEAEPDVQKRLMLAALQHTAFAGVLRRILADLDVLNDPRALRAAWVRYGPPCGREGAHDRPAWLAALR